MVQEIKKSVCYFCKGYCPVLVITENGRLTSVEDDPSDPGLNTIFPRTKGCIRRRAAKEFMYHPDRVHFPLKRAGERGEGKWERISWEQAFDEITKRLQGIKDRYGAEAVAGVKGTFRNKSFQTRFFMLFGSPNSTTAGKICYGPLFAVSNAMFGWSGGRYSFPGGHRVVGGVIPKCIFLTGTDPLESWPRVANIVRESKKAGGKLVAVDPRETWLTKQADIWLQLRPGTDTALFMSMIHVIIEEGLYDKDFVEKWCYGFDKLAERAREYPPEKVAGITWVPADKIREAARMLGQNKPFYSWNGMGTEQLQNSIQAIHARFILAAITGSIDVEGGTYVGRPGKMRGIDDTCATEKLPPEQRRKQLGADRFRFTSFPGYELIAENTMRVHGRMPPGEPTATASPHQPTIYRAMITGQPYPVKGLIVHAHNPMVVQANTKLVYKALKSLDLSVVMDYWLTPTAELADYVLPVASWLERPDFMGDYGGEQALPSCIPGECDHKNDFEIFRGLGTRLGQDWPWESLEEVFDYCLEPGGMTFKQFLERENQGVPVIRYKNYEKTGFATTTGKAELYSTILEKLGYDPLPQYEEPPESPISKPELAEEYPLILITGGRFRPLFHSEWRQIESIRRLHPYPLAQVHPETAQGLGIHDGDWIWIESPRGRIRMKCQHYEGIDRRVVHCQHGWWYPELPGEEPWLHGVWESNVNVLTDDDPDRCNPITGGWPLRTALCKIYKMKQY